MGKILIKNGRVWTGAKFSIGDVLTDGRNIVKIALSIDAQADFIFDAMGKIVSPGLVDLHVHLKGLASEEFAMHTEMSCFPFGVTAVNDAGSIYGNKEFLEQFAVKTTVFVCVDIKDNHVDLTNMEERLAQYGERAIGFKIYFDRNISKVTDITPLKEICEYAKARNLKVMVHCSNSPTPMSEIIGTLSKGDILTHAYHGGIHSCTEDGSQCFQLAKERGVIVDAGFAGHVHTDFQNLELAIQRGYLPDTISTDITKYSAYRRGGRYGMTMCMSMARRAGMSEEDIFKAITTVPAQVLDKSSEWGVLEEGRCADIAVLDFADEAFWLQDNAGNILESNNGYRCVLTISDGEVVYKD